VYAGRSKDPAPLVNSDSQIDPRAAARAGMADTTRKLIAAIYTALQ